MKVRDKLAIYDAVAPERDGRARPYTATLTVVGTGGLGMGWKVVPARFHPA